MRRNLKPRGLILGFAMAFICSIAARAEALGPCEREMARAADLHGIPLGVLYSVGLTETGGKRGLRPYAMNIDGRAMFPRDLAEALLLFDEARQAGAKFVDVGCMQINHRWHARQFASVREMFDPTRNVAYAARLLKQLRARQPSWTMAVARYNAGPNNDPAQKKYVCAVIRNMVASGFGGWTPEARAFCEARAAR